MPGEKSKKSRFMQRCVGDVVAGGKDKGAAFAICTAQSQKAGYSKPGSVTQTPKGAAREKFFKRQPDMADKGAAYERALGRKAEGMEAVFAGMVEAREVAAAVKDLPRWLKAALKELGYRGRTIEVQAAERVDPNPSAGEGEKGFVTIVNLDTGEARTVWGDWGGGSPAGAKPVDAVREAVRIPAGGAVLVGTKGGGLVDAVAYVHPDSMARLLPAHEEVVDMRSMLRELQEGSDPNADAARMIGTADKVVKILQDRLDAVREGVQRAQREMTGLKRAGAGETEAVQLLRSHMQKPMQGLAKMAVTSAKSIDGVVDQA